MSVELRPLTAASAGAVTSQTRAEDWHRDYPGPQDLEVARLWTAWPWQPPPCQVVVHGQVVGSIGSRAEPRDGHVEVGLSVVDGVRGHGVGTEAFELLLAELSHRGCTRVTVAAEQGDPPSHRLLLHAGFRIAGEDSRTVIFEKVLTPPAV